MQRFELLLATFVMLAIGGGMAAYEWTRVKSKRRLFGGGPIITLYWCTYLSLLALALTTAVAAVVRG